MSMLFSPVSLGRLSLPNRIVIPPMCQYSSTWDGRVSPWHDFHYGPLSLSGAGLMIVEATAVEPEGRISGSDIGIWSDDHARSLAGLLERIRRYSDIRIGIQLGHAGRKGSRMAFIDKPLSHDDGGWNVVAPSAISYGDGYPVPAALAMEEIEALVGSFAESAQRASKAGFHAVEIHAAHGYLLHQFLSPLANKRTDGYGGSLKNRMRFTLEVFQAVRAILPASKPVGVRISGSDWAEGGWTEGDSIVLAQELEARGCAYIHVSGGGMTPVQSLAIGPGYQVGMARAIKGAVAMPVVAVGLITQAEQAETILQAGSADLVAVGRGMLYNPRWPWHAAAELGESVKAPVQYIRSHPRTAPNLFRTMAF